MRVGKYLLLFASLTSLLYIGNGCQMEDVDLWLLTQEVQILDTYRGTFWNKTTSNINSMTGITVGGSVNYAPYLDIQWDENGYFTISTSSGYDQYEENETSEFISFTVNFECTTGGTINSLIFSIAVQDTNNNPPMFRPSDQYEFTITPPLPPGFQITGCGGDDIVVRDIDLTTSSIDFTIEENPYFEISYEGQSLTDPKEFLASLKTKDLIRSLSEDLELTISATDVDATQDPRITRYATIRVKADEEFLFPEEPVFTQPFYMATYANNQVVLENEISLQQGYDEQVTFSLEGEYSNYLRLVSDGNTISIEISTGLSSEVLRNGHIIVVVRAEREYTSGTTATIIIQLPEVFGLEFEQAQYAGRIVDNTLEILQLTLKQGYEEGFNIELQNEYSSYFSTTIQGNVIILSMPAPLAATIIDENNFISLRVIASNEYSTATTVVNLDIVKDDNVTPVFEKAIYTGDYDPYTGLAVEQIILEQGYDETLSFSLKGEHSEYFSITNDGPNIILSSSGIPTELWTEQQLLLAITATKPRTVTATTAIFITLPSARQLAFEAPTYAGTLQDNTMNLGAIVLSVGYAEDINFSLIGDYASYFTVSPAQNEVSIKLSAALPEAVILDNNFLTLTLSASGLHAVPTSTTILLEIIRQDLNTPVFSENIYAGSYTSANSIEIGNISLAQGYDSSVSFKLDGEHAQYFEIAHTANNLNLVLVSTIPPEMIFMEKVLLFNILAEKALTVGANAAVSIAFPQEMTDATAMRFSQNTYVGSVENNALALENIILEAGYETGTEFSLSGEYVTYFQLQYTENLLNIWIQNQLPEELLENNDFIILEIEASRERAVSVSASVVIALEKKEIVPPGFSNAYYKSIYSNGNLESLTITLSDGYDDTVTFELQGDSSVWFSITNVGNIVQLALNTSNDKLEDILENNDYFLFSVIANKPNTTSARAAVFIHLRKEIPEAVIVRFSQSSYVGRIDKGELYAPAITLLGEREPIYFNITGDHAQFFEVTQTSPTNVELRLRNDFLPENIDELSFIIIDIEAQYPEAISGQTTVILEIVKEPGIVTPVFEQAYYTGEYSEQGGLQFEQSIRLSQGFDESVVFTLAGDDAQWFELNNTADNNLTLVVSNSGLEQIRDRNHLVFSIIAYKVGSVVGNAAIIVNLADSTTTISLKFAQDFYVGFIENNNLSVNNINIVEGYSPEVNISFTGDDAEYFQLTNQEGVFTLELLSELPANIIDDNNVLVFTLEAQIENTRTHTTIVLEFIKTELTPLAFEEAYYVGSYSRTAGFTFDPQITLIEGYDETVSFSLNGDESEWFSIVENQYPLLLTQTLPIPNEVVSRSQQLLFVILAEKPGNVTARSTIIVSIIDDTTVLEFERNVYLGTIQENNVTTNIDIIVLSSGYSANVSFSLIGALESYFTITQQEESVTISLQTNIPNELVPNNRIILLELQASAPQAVSAYANLVFGIVRHEVAFLHFSEIYYTGRYSDLDGLDFRNNITLAAGYDDTVQYILEGDDSQYFQTVILENSVFLVLASQVPTELIMNRSPLIFTIRADKFDTASAHATIVIELVNELQTTVLRFDQTSYLGSMENNTINLESIILSEGYNQNVSYSLQGEFESYFTLSSEEKIVTITLKTPIPQDLTQDKRIIILELQACAQNAMSAHAAIVIEVVQEEITTILEQLIFNEVYYIGHYTEADGLTFADTITLIEGYNENVTFALDGDNSQYFEAVVTDNSVSLRLTTPIPSVVVLNNHQLIFTIRADKLDALTGRATIVISLLNEHNEDIQLLGFDRITYVGSLENDSLDLDQITLIDGYSTAVVYRLFGDLESYFALTAEGSAITVTLTGPIPEQLIPDNRIIVLELEASATGFMSAHAAIVIEIVQEEITTILEQLVFNEVYYIGHYTEEDGLTFTDTITLIEGYNENVTFVLDGDNSQYFEAVVTDNSVSLRLTTPIPSVVILNNHQLIFTIRADKLDALTGRATIVISLLNEHNEDIQLLGFDRITYVGSLENDSLDLDQITLIDGYSTAVVYRLFGDLESYFALTAEGSAITVTLTGPIPEQLIPDNGIIILELEASATRFISAHAAIVIEVVQEEITTIVEQLVFNEVYYIGHYTEEDGLTFTDTITLIEGYNENVTFALEGDSSQYFEAVVTANSVSLRLTTPIPSAVAVNNHQLVFTICAGKPSSINARATVVISLLDEFNEGMNLLGFERTIYVGSVGQDSLNLAPVTLIEGYSEAVTFRLLGDLNGYFVLNSEGATNTLSLNSPIPVELIPENRLIILELEASAPNTLSAHASLVVEIVKEDVSLDKLIFSEPYYTGYFSGLEGLTFEDDITLTEGYNANVTFTLEGDDAQYFEAVVVSENSISLKLVNTIPPAIVMNNQQLIFTILASAPNAVPVRATIVISLHDEYTESTPVLGFNRISYVGSIEGDSANIESVILSEGYSSNVEFTLHGDLQNYFTLIRNEANVDISLVSVIPEEFIPSNQIIVLEIQASAPDTISAYATIVLEVVQNYLEEMTFSESYYTGHYSVEEGLILNTMITLSHGYDDNVQFSFEGDHSQWFQLTVLGSSVSIILTSSIPEDVLESNRKLIFVIVAQKAEISTRATIIISLVNEAVCSDAWFGKVLYEGFVQSNEVQHETIGISGYEGTDIQLVGEFAELFSASLSEGVVTVQVSGSVTLSPDYFYVALELRVATASAVLLLDVVHTENPELPSVTFSSSSYALRTDVTQTGLVGQVLAIADNREAVAYSLAIDDTHLLQRISINHEGELHLWAPANIGVYRFQVLATTIFSKVTGTAAVHLTVEAITIGGDDDYVLPPLQILDRDEESPHENLVPFNASAFEGCRYVLSNRWPADQSWLYVDETGLHANAIDREHESIAFMALSQIQVELILQCDSDNESTRSKRFINSGSRTDQLEHLGPYDYGNSKWIITDSIRYNPRLTLVNLIVNDINDNYPIFIGKEDEPIVVGYPESDLEESILPRALVEVQATDADVGENAALVYWSAEEILAVSSTTGSVHVRDIAGLESDMILTVYATDRNGQGLTGSLDLLVKLVNTSHIAVVTVKNAFLDDEKDILTNITAALGYEVKALKSSVISTDFEELESRKKREAIVSPGSSLLLYVYGLVEREPVNVERLTEDINTSVIETVIIASTVSLEDHLENLVICPLPGRDTALFVSTIVLAVLLFILIVAAAVWFFLKWRKKQNYDEFSDENSFASQDDPVSPVSLPKSEQPTPRMKIEDLKRSEERLQQMLDAPLDIAPQPAPAQRTSEKPIESKVNIPELPLVIQSFDKLKDADESDEDEFGERKKNRRKSVVTFNENVEKIIHVDPPDDSDLEVYRL